MNKALHTEFQKAHRRHDLWICLAVPLAAAIWSASAMPRGADELANAYSALLYSLPVLNTVLMPLAMAALASRLWDVEVKGCTVKLLYTLQTRRSLFAAKAVFGAGEILLMVLLELAATALLGYIQHYTEAFPAAQLAYLGVCTYGVNLMLFFSELIADAGFQQSDARALRGDCRHAAGAVFRVYAAACQLLCAVGVLRPAGLL